jgi:hypothetical protein
MKKSPRDNIGKLLVGIISVLFIIAISNSFRHYYSLKKYKRYTIGITTKKAKEGRVTTIYYYYTYKGKRYEGEDEFRNGIKYPDVRYYILISSERPDFNEFTRIVVPDSIKDVPSDGWAEIPKNTSNPLDTLE